MADIEIQRTHGLDWAGAQALAQAWRAQAETDWGMKCSHSPGEGEDRLTFERAGAQGLLRVNATQFELQITLGFLLRAYKTLIAEKINLNLDEALARLEGS
jgi:putative polyhydroxyalkanoate system protein